MGVSAALGVPARVLGGCRASRGGPCTPRSPLFSSRTVPGSSGRLCTDSASAALWPGVLQHGADDGTAGGRSPSREYGKDFFNAM